MRVRAAVAALVVLLAALAGWLALREHGATPPGRAGTEVREPPAPPTAPEEIANRERVRTAAHGAADAADEDAGIASDAPRRIAGRVVRDEEETIDELPVAGAQVTLLARPRTRFDDAFEGKGAFLVDVPSFPGDEVFRCEVPSDVLASAVTDAEGRFAFPGEHAAADVLVRAEADGFVPAQVGGEDRDGALTIFVAEPETLLRIRVVDASGEPIPKATALLFSDVDVPPVAEFRAGPDGRLEIPILWGELVVRAPGFAPAWLSSPTDYHDRALVLGPGTTIAGIVCDSDGQGIADAAVRLTWTPVAPVTTDAAGRFRFEHVPESADWSHLDAVAPGRLAGSASARPGATDVRIELPFPARLSGVVVDEAGRPAAEARLRSVGPGPGFVRRRATSDASGRFELTGLAPGRLRLEAVVEERLTGGRPELPVPLRRGETTVTVAPDAHVDGVRIVVTPVPISFVCITVLDPQGAPTEPSVSIPANVEGDLGTHRGEGFQAGTADRWRWWRVLVAPGTDVPVAVNAIDARGVVRPQGFTVTTCATPGGPPAVLALAPTDVAPQAVLRLVTVRTDGREIPADAYVAWQCRWDGGAGEGVRDAGSPPSGRLDVTRGREVTVTASAEGCGSLTFRVPAVTEDTTFTCALPPEAVVVGRLVTATGTPVGRAYGSAVVALAGGGESVSEFWFEQLGADGRFEFPQLSAGRCRVLVYDEDDRIRAHRELDLREGARVDLGDVVVDRLPLLRGTILRDGVATGGVAVRAWTEDATLGSTTSRPDGTFELAVIAGADGEIVVEDDAGRQIVYDLAEARATSPVRLVVGAGADVALTLAGGVADPEWTLATTCRLAGGLRIVPDDYATGDVVTLYGLPRARVEVVVRAVDDATGTVHATWRAVVTAGPSSQQIVIERER